MANKFIKKQNLVIVLETYKDKEGNDKKKYQRIGELVTMEADDGRQYQFGEIFYPKANFSVYDITEKEGTTTKKAQVPTIQQDGSKEIKDLPF